MTNSSRELIKTCARTLARVLMFPLFLLYRPHLALAASPEAIAGYSQLVSIIPGTTGIYLRREFYRLALRFCSQTAQIGFGTIFSTADVEIHEGVLIGNYCRLGQVIISDNTFIASGVAIISGLEQHQRNADGRIENSSSKETISIGASCWIGEGALVAADISEGANIAAGAVVLKPVAAALSVFGNPARSVKADSSS